MSADIVSTREMPAILRSRLRRLESTRELVDLSGVITKDCRRQFCKSLGSMLMDVFGMAYLSVGGEAEEVSVSDALEQYARDPSSNISEMVFAVASHPDYRGFDDVAPLIIEAIRPCWRRFSMKKVVDRSEFHIDFQLRYYVYRTAFSDPQMLWIQLQMVRASLAHFDPSVVPFVAECVSSVEGILSTGAMPSDREMSVLIKRVPQFVGDYEPLAMSMVFQPTSVGVPLEFASLLRGVSSQEFDRQDASVALGRIDKIIRDSFGGEIPSLTLSASGSVRW